MFVMRLLGVGRQGLNLFCNYMDIGSGIAEETYNRIFSHIHVAAKTVFDYCCKKAVEDEKKENEKIERPILNFKVSGDGTWKKRGFKSLFGETTLIAYYCGKVIDRSSYCHACAKWQNKPKNSREYLEWKKDHCTKNHEGSAGNMEVESVKKMFLRLEELHGVKYIGEGDSKTFAAILNLNPYGDETALGMELKPHSTPLHPDVQKELIASFQFRQDATSFYTDGSKDEDCAGAAVISPEMNGDIRHKLPANTSIFSAELLAIYQVVQTIMDLDISRGVIFSDSKNSKSALEALCNPQGIHRNYIIYYIKKAFYEIQKQGKSVTLFWVPVHVGIPGNEAADLAAKDAAIDGFKPPFRVPYEDMLPESTAQAKRQSVESMKVVSAIKGTLYYENFYSQSKHTWFHDFHISREEIIHVNRIRSNHINVNESLYRVNMTESPACECGDPRQSINHLIFHCDKYSNNSIPIRNFIANKYEPRVIHRGECGPRAPQASRDPRAPAPRLLQGGNPFGGSHHLNTY
ncbi:hypothetical protein ALC62_00832 [Cyphomyrmex costatus]|uniref:RNase H type-1 domain-containing protein n=1 Tax=Cyphomyrmex costatus TaxID=456900 RepID=A0A151IPX7_9HYME|nr:hypothetical protein ALC62_00832 [Cyphomyrmex costatus]